MGTKLSRPILNLLNEIHVIFGCGLIGVFVAISRVKNEYYWRSMLSLGILGAGIIYTLKPGEKRSLSRNNIIVVTGCDSGLGHALVRHLSKHPVTIVATFLNLESEGALLIKTLFDQNSREALCHLIEMDIVNSDDIEELVKFVAEVIRNNPGHKLTALVNNSGVMAFGEFEWQTEAIMRHQISVNFLGTIMLTHNLLPMLRQDRGRIVTVTSHCGIETLPGLSIYGATKKALAGWMDAIRVELRPYGVHAITFIPGSFVMSSNISARQNMLANEMRCAMSAEQMSFYGEYFDRYNSYLSILSGDKPAGSLTDRNIMSTCEHALFDLRPKAVYKCEPPRYTMYYTIFQWAPYWLRDYLVVKFMNTPTYGPKNFNEESVGSNYSIFI